MIPCRLSTDDSNINHLGWPLHTCSRCGRSWHMAGHHSTWMGDPVLCRKRPDWWEIGHWLRLYLEAAGLNQDRYRWLRSKLGLTPVCGCGQRAEALNTIGSRFANGLTALWKFLTRKQA